MRRLLLVLLKLRESADWMKMNCGRRLCVKMGEGRGGLWMTPEWKRGMDTGMEVLFKADRKCLRLFL